MRIATNRMLVTLMMCLSFVSWGQKSKKQGDKSNKDAMTKEQIFEGFKLRGIGPAFMSGRIADIAIHPENENTWYVAVGSGGVWKTVNAGTTWTPIFDEQTSYSTGCITIDPSSPSTIWVGTGENVGGRHVGFGDGVYRSQDGGKSWENMGLPRSEHISKIIVHPNNSKVVWVAAQGPLWSKGGERGLYKTTDGGKTWNKTLGDNEWVGVTDIAIDPRNPMRLYAATWQRHRTVAAYMGGGPGSGLHKSEDGGETWEELEKGLPTSWMGKIGLAISPQNPDILYAAIELDRRTGAVYRSADRGASWEKRSEAVSGATGPHYYQELYASPHQFEKLYLVDVRMQISDDGGKNFYQMKEEHKHSDNHAIAFKNSDPDYLLVGTDGGLYESFDLAANWRYIDNLPLTQFYKLAVDDAKPFYNIYGGTQDNSTEGGPSRTDNVHGIQNSDWRVVLNWDGHQPATEPGNPDIMYAERQEGNLSRVDLTTGEVVDIQPQPDAGEDHERFNWDAPILVSSHDPKRIYFASSRVWRSDNRGDEWKAISGDLTKDQERIELPIMGKKQSWDAPWDFLAMSNYNTITSLAESPKNENVLYAGTDDGIIQVTEDGGANWRKIEVSSLPGVPATAFVNDIKADLYDANTVYVVLDNHKYGDYRPFLFKSTDKGRNWQSMTANLPAKTLLWRIVQDHEQANLLFLASEYGIYFTINGGKSWVKFTGNMPTISFRDLAIQRRENDLVGASFGRGFFVLDDYTPLRNVTEESLAKEGMLFAPRDAWWYIPRSHISFDEVKGSLGASHFVAPNPDFGAVFTYYLKEDMKTPKESRQEKEKEMDENANIPFAGWDAVAAEANSTEPQIVIAVSNSAGKVIRKIYGAAKKGFHRIAWDLRYPASESIPLDGKMEAQGFMAAPGKYTATLSKMENGIATQLGEPVSFEVKPLREGALKGASNEEVAAFWRTYEDLISKVSAFDMQLSKANKQIKAMMQASQKAQAQPGVLEAKAYSIYEKLNALSQDFYGNKAKGQVGEKGKPTVNDRMFAIYKGVEHSTYGPTASHLKTVEIINTQLADMNTQFSNIQKEVTGLKIALKQANAPYVEE